MWPWSRFRHLQLQINKLEGQLVACGIAAHGVYPGLDHSNYSESLVEVIGLQKRCERYEKFIAEQGFVNLPP